jgi:hypothetical protein
MKGIPRLGVVDHTCNPSTWEAEAGGQSGLHKGTGLKNKEIGLLM